MLAHNLTYLVCRFTVLENCNYDRNMALSRFLLARAGIDHNVV